MNSLIIFPEEIKSDKRAVLSGNRAKYVIENHVLEIGSIHKGGLYGGERGTLTCAEISDSSVTFVVNLTEPPLQRTNASLIVAVPRPQTVKKVIQAATSFGVRELHFVRSAHVVPSYLSSKTLTPEAILSECLKALEQTCDTVAPQIFIHPAWRSFSSDVLPNLSKGYEARLIAHTKESEKIPHETSSVLAAVGPESGWIGSELSDFTSHGFKSCTLGPRMLRVEHAVIKVLSCLH